MMRFSTPCLVLLAVLLSYCARAQQYRPFRFGTSYQLVAGATPGDTTHLLRLASRQLLAGDSVFTFSPRTSYQPRTPNQPRCGDYVRRADNLFGTTMTLRPGGVVVLATANGRTFTLRPRAPLGQGWAATAAGLTAQVTARSLGTVLGQPDSLATIALSDGATIVLSRRFGWVSGPALGHYLNARLPAAALTLTALPELGLGSPRLGAFEVYDFQPGDVFLRRTNTIVSLSPGVLCTTYEWTRDSILSRTRSANGDTLRYQQRSRTLMRDCAGRFTLGTPTVQTLRITRTTGGLDQPTNFWAQSASSAAIGSIHLPAYRTSSYYQRLVQPQFNYRACNTVSPDSTVFMDANSIDFGHHTWTALGLGLTREEHDNYFSTDNTELLGYRKGSESWGQLTTFAQLLPARASRPASTTAAFPNPFAAELAVSFELSRPQAVGLMLRDALGREVLTQAPAPLPAGSQRLRLPTAALPEGVYTLHLHFAADGHTEVLRVLKAQ